MKPYVQRLLSMLCLVKHMGNCTFLKFISSDIGVEAYTWGPQQATTDSVPTLTISSSISSFN
jgi:hypothetical protein